MWFELLYGLVLYKFIRIFFAEDDLIDIETSDSDAVFEFASRCIFFMRHPVPISWTISWKCGFVLDLFVGSRRCMVERCMWVFEFPMPIQPLYKILTSFFLLLWHGDAELLDIGTIATMDLGANIEMDPDSRTTSE